MDALEKREFIKKRHAAISQRAPSLFRHARQFPMPHWATQRPEIASCSYSNQPAQRQGLFWMTRRKLILGIDDNPIVPNSQVIVGFQINVVADEMRTTIAIGKVGPSRVVSTKRAGYEIVSV